MKEEEYKETKKAKYEKPVLVKFKKLSDVVANGSVPKETGLGCARF